VLSRVADTLYWMRRYIERADHIARVVDVNLDLAFDRSPLDVVRLWGRLLSALWAAPAWAQVDRGEAGGALADLASVDAVASCVAAARENARQVRQHISAEMWERVNGLHLTLNDPARRAAWEERPHGYFKVVREGAALFDAAVRAGMVRDEGWHFLQLGLFLERAGGAARLVRCQLREVQPAADAGQALDQQLDWICLLRACDALELYRRRNRAELQPDRIVRFLIDDPLSPCTVRYALGELARSLAALAETVPDQPPVVVSPGVTSSLDLSGSDGFDPLAAVAAIEAECDRLHRAVHEIYIDQTRMPAPVT
jgi:uncharacterized alpha-E superfamily protein